MGEWVAGFPAASTSEQLGEQGEVCTHREMDSD